MSEYSQLEVDFIKRTLHLLESYRGEYEVTMLINCSLGLLVFPKEIMDRNLNYRLGVHDIPVRDLDPGWGIQRHHILEMGIRASRSEAYTENTFVLSQLTRRLRNALVHGHFRTLNEGQTYLQITTLSMRDKNGFRAEIRVEDLRTFAVRLAKTILSNIEAVQATATNEAQP